MTKYTKLITLCKQGSLNDRMTLVYPPHLEWLLDIVEKLGSGKMVKLGVVRGGCIALCAVANPNLKIIGCDSWLGMPEITKEDNTSKCQ